MLSTRLVTGFAMAGVTAAILSADEWMAPWFPLWLAFCLLTTGAAALELIGLLSQTSAKPSGNALFAGVLVVTLANWGPHLVAHLSGPPPLSDRAVFDPMGPLHALAWPLLSYVGVVMLTFVTQGVQFQTPGRTMATISGTVLGVTYIGVLGSFLVQMRWFDGPYHGLLPLALLIMTAKGADIGAYTLGRLAGRHKLWPSLSPNKTIEGALGGMLFSVLGALIITVLARVVLGAPGLSWLGAVIYGLVVGVTAQLGDLMESMIKRDCARKDASDAVPGFGGVLDVVDSLLFAGPVGFGMWLFLGP
ncbi:MAG: phosphatidate cytidylyltransferase [Isosphaeraceae bacterium]